MSLDDVKKLTEVINSIETTMEITSNEQAKIALTQSTGQLKAGRTWMIKALRELGIIGDR